MKKLGIAEAKWPLTARDGKVPAWADARNKDDWDLRMAVYAAQVEVMDRGVGRVLDTLRELKLAASRMEEGLRRIEAWATK